MTAQSQSAPLQGRGLDGAAFLPGERILLGYILVLMLGTLALVWGLGRDVDWAGFAPGVAAAFGMVAIGGYARARAKAPRLAAGAIGVGAFMAISALSAIFIFALFPLHNPLIDLQLMRIDAVLGYDWAGFVTALSAYPALVRPLAWLYHSSLPQILGLVVILAVQRREVQMQRLLLSGCLALVVTTAIWWLWPSIGPSGFAQIPTVISQSIGLLTSPEVGAALLHLAQAGPGVIRPEVVTGVVAFPSYHIVMALMVAVYARGTWYFPLALIAAVLMVPTTLSHGGHHLVDLIAGALVFTLAAWVARRLVPDAAA
ncbi:phosphatase PAP2 family protein [Xinfangfangia sp. CPCC 101601]|uniref:Phosphatase PAP2 family protein n=1 Tax=Pseudogemmobacter lacusdianii TaxID=3069608 RepID=A0ABU0W060_9RHOB|nr:phosphatase PAP2 family protein [Xinfangfangia sp. CPCC 101601]MDQ2067383.1 phosphatase PAP2 family protein [Xinfangfangia sp. CPCC 101601]